MTSGCRYPNIEYTFFFMLLLWASCGENPLDGDPIIVRDAWIREPPPRSPAAGYLTIENRGDELLELIGVQTEIAERSEIHVMEDRGGRMTMRRTERVAISAGTQVVLKSGGTHLMLMGLRQRLMAGDSVELLLRFGDGVQRRVKVPVRKEGYASD